MAYILLCAYNEALLERSQIQFEVKRYVKLFKNEKYLSAS
jgi:hypothetical protein